MESTSLVDCVGRRRSPATLPGYHRGRPPRNKGLRYPPDPPTVDEIVAVLRAAGDSPDGVRLRGVIVVLWRAGLRIWAWEQLMPWLKLRLRVPTGPLFCVLRGPTRGRPCAAAAMRIQLHNAARAAGIRRRFAPHQLRHAHAVEMSREGVPPLVIQRQLVTPISGSHPCTCAASRTPKWSTRSTSDPRR